MSWARDVQSTLGRTGTAVSVLCAAAGVMAFLSGLRGDSASGTYGTLIGSWLFFAGGALGAVTFLIGYTVVLSIWAFDFVLGPDPVFGSTIMGPWVFVGSFLAGTDLLVLLALRRGELSPSDQRDASSFVLALTVFWTYLFASQALTIWYGNLPDETEFLIRRLDASWGWTGLAMLVLVFATPFAALLQGAARASRRVLAAVLVGQAVGLWIELQILVVPSLTRGDALAPLHPRVLMIALGMLGVFLLCVAPALRRLASPGAEVPLRPEAGVSRRSGG